MTSPSSSNTTRAAMKSCSSTPALTPPTPSWRSHTRSKALPCLTNTSSESSFPRIGCSKRVSLNVHSCIYETRYKWWISLSQFSPFLSLSLTPRLSQHTRKCLCVPLNDVGVIERCVCNKTRQWQQQQNRIRWFIYSSTTNRQFYLPTSIFFYNNLP